MVDLDWLSSANEAVGISWNSRHYKKLIFLLGDSCKIDGEVENAGGLILIQ
jgi:hypothetical protein